MARLPRLVLPGHTHYVIQRGHSGEAAPAVFTDHTDRGAYREAMRAALEVAQREATSAGITPLLLNAWALLPGEVQLMVTAGSDARALSRFVQDLGRRYVSAYNRRHARRGALWDGRFRCSVLEAGPTRLAALRLIDGQSMEPGFSSASHRIGAASDPLLTDPPELWSLGNTPFERESAYRALLAQGVPQRVAEHLRRAALGGWAAGSAAHAADVAERAARPARPRLRGRPAGPRA